MALAYRDGLISFVGGLVDFTRLLHSTATGGPMTSKTASTRTKKLVIAAVVVAVIAILAGKFISDSFSLVPNAAKEGCVNRVEDTLPDGANPEFKELTVRESISAKPDWAKSWSVSGTVNTVDMIGLVRDVDFNCTMYVTGSGNVSDGTVRMNW